MLSCSGAQLFASNRRFRDPRFGVVSHILRRGQTHGQRKQQPEKRQEEQEAEERRQGGQQAGGQEVMNRAAVQHRDEAKMA